MLYFRLGMDGMHASRRHPSVTVTIEVSVTHKWCSVALTVFWVMELGYDSIHSINIFIPQQVASFKYYSNMKSGLGVDTILACKNPCKFQVGGERTCAWVALCFCFLAHPKGQSRLPITINVALLAFKRKYNLFKNQSKPDYNNNNNNDNNSDNEMHKKVRANYILAVDWFQAPL